MSERELFKLVEKLRAEYGAAFKTWYDFANYPDIEHYCEIGWLLSRHYPEGER